MTKKELIKQLRTVGENHNVEVEMEIETECGHVCVISKILDVQFKRGNCVLHGSDYS